VDDTGPKRDFVGYGRYPPRIKWPGGAALAISIVVNYESGAEHSYPDDGQNDAWGEYAEGAGEQARDLGTETHYEFGSRVGIWRLSRLFDRLGVPVSVGASALALERNPALGEWIVERGHEAIGHGYRWAECWRMTRQEEAAEMRKAVETLERLVGSHPAGWYVRSFPSPNTLSLLVEEGGFLYSSDPCNDELPYFADVDGTPFLVVPYSKTYNDSRYFIEPTYASPRHFNESLRDAVEYHLLEVLEGGSPRMMTLGVHERWSGQASRAAALADFLEYAKERAGVLFMRRVDIARCFLESYDPSPTESP
jgi:peptidoglycan/xylan/chitin deacetylase (PgdA/CDA1 family)